MGHGCRSGSTGGLFASGIRFGRNRCGQNRPKLIDIAEGEGQGLSGLFDDTDQLLGVLGLSSVHAYKKGLHGVFSMATGIGASEGTLAQRQSQMSHGWGVAGRCLPVSTNNG